MTPIDKIRPFVTGGTPAERRMARFLLDNLNELPFETAQAISDQLDLSPMTVSRFLRRLGFQGLEGLKASLRTRSPATAWGTEGTSDGLRHDLENGRLLAEVMTEQVETLHRIYEMTNTPEWQRSVTAILKAKAVFVASYQNIGGIARYFAEQLSYARDDVRYSDGLNGTYVEILGRPADGAILILIDARRFAAKSRLLSDAAAEIGLDTLVITDAHCDWVEPGRHRVMTLPPSRSRTWDNFMSLAALLDFLVTAVVVEGGEAVRRRTERLAALQNHFGDFEKR